VKSYENRLEIGEVTDKSVGTRLRTTLYIVFIHLRSELSVITHFSSIVSQLIYM